MASALREKRRRSKSILTIPKRASAARDELLYQASEEEEGFAAPYSVKVLQIHFMLKLYRPPTALLSCYLQDPDSPDPAHS
jgi:hypothetical protein